MFGLTVMLAVFAPVLQVNIVPPVAVKVALSLSHIVWSAPASAMGKGLTFTTVEAVAVHPSALVTVTL